MDGDFRIGSWLVEPSLNTVSSNGTKAQLEPKVMAVLVCLAKHAPDPVPKEILRQEVWGDTFVGEGVLTRSVFELRRVFEDDARESKFIQTISKRGYRLVAPVGPANGNAALTAPVFRVPLLAKLFAMAAILAVVGVLSAVLSAPGLRNWLAQVGTADTLPAHAEPRIQEIPPVAVKKGPARAASADPKLSKQTHSTGTVENGPSLSTNSAIGNPLVSVEAAAARVETRFRNIPPDMVRTRVTRAVLPRYPEFAKQAHITGTVEIGLGVSPRGDVASARVLTGHPALITPALEAIRKWRFQPNLVQGELTWSRMRALVRFNADGTTAVAFARPLLADSFGDPGDVRDELREAMTPPIAPGAH